MLNRQNNNNLNDLLGDMDPLASKKPTAKTPAAFLGENSALVNLDNLIKPINNTTNNNAYNPFESPAMKTKNLFQQNQPQVRVCLEAERIYFDDFDILESVHKSAKAAATVPGYAKPGSMGASEQQRDSSGELALFSALAPLINVNRTAFQSSPFPTR